MNNKTGFFFGYGGYDFGYDDFLAHNLSADLNLNEGCGIALIAGKHLNFKNLDDVSLKISNFSDCMVTVRIEKKFLNDVKTKLVKIEASSTCNLNLLLDDNDKNMIELVVAVLRDDNGKKKYAIKLDY